MLLFSELFSSRALFSGLYPGFTFYGKEENTGGGGPVFIFLYTGINPVKTVCCCCLTK